jgi:plastocyanin
MNYSNALMSILVLLFVVACSGASTGPPASSTTAPASGPTPSSSGGGGGAQVATVNIGMTDAYQFAPASISVKAGTTVTWMNTGQQAHTSTDDASKAINPSDSVLPSGAEPWDSGLLNAGQSYSHTFATPGQYTYFCTPHEALGMVARVTVTP